LYCSDNHTNQSEQTSTTVPAPAAQDSIPAAVNCVPDTDVKRPPDYSDALRYRSAEEEGYPEPSLVDQPPSYDAIY